MKRIFALLLALTLLLTGCHAPEQQPQSPEIIPDEQIEAIPEDIPLDVVYEDKELMVIFQKNLLLKLKVFMMMLVILFL